MARAGRNIIVWAALLACLPNAGARAAAHRITYLTSATAYVDAGRGEGVAVGTRMEVVRAGVVVGVLVATDVSSHRAACTIESATGPLAVGDAVRYTPQAIPAADSAGTAAVAPVAPSAVFPPAEPESAPAVSWARRNGLRGRVGVRYLGVNDRSGLGGDVRQPSADVRLDGNRVGGSAFDVQVDVRARHTVQTVADGREFDDGQARVYRLNSAWHPPDHRVRMTLGRQFSSALTSVSTFDGVQAEYDVARWGVGTFAGTQPQAIDYGFSTDITEYGAFARVRSAPRAPVRWEGVIAGIGSYEEGKINREYLSLVGRLSSARFALMGLQEIDIYRGWREAEENAGASLTSTFATARYRVTPALDLDAGYDNRRDVRLYRDFVSPETEFDDSYRQGFWGGVGVRVAARARLGLSARSSQGGGAGDATSVTGTASVTGLTPLHLAFRLRFTRYGNERTEGWMNTFSGIVPAGRLLTFELYGGTRNEDGMTASTPDVSTSWFGVNADALLRNNWYLNLSGERNGQGDNAYDQVYTGLSWRF